MDMETAGYIFKYFPRLLNKNERDAWFYCDLPGRSERTYRDDSILFATYIASPNEINDFVIRTGGNMEALRFFERGKERFYLNAATRIMEETHEKVFLNNCPVCSKLAFTPFAKQCRHCKHDWHHVIGADFKVNHVFDLPERPGLLFFIGNIKRGIVTKGMKVDLTFVEVALKPELETIVILAPIFEVALDFLFSFRIHDAEDVRT